MTDIIDVENTLVNLVAGVVYPTGTSNPSIVGHDIIVYPGWPDPATLDADLKVNKSHISVFPMPGMDANTTRFLAQMTPKTSIPAAQLTMTLASNKITIGGAINAGEAACANVNYQAYAYGVLASDTTATVAAGLAAKIPGATASGSVITITGAFEIVPLVSVPVSMQQEIARQTRVFMITAWCQNPTIRDQIMGAVDVALKQPSNKRILLPDNTLARLIYRGTLVVDSLQKQNIYRRDLRYEVEYVTTGTETDNTVTNLAVSTTPAGGATFIVNI